MARLANKNSTRQKVFTYLNRHSASTRTATVKNVIGKFNINEPYAATLVQAHRTLAKKDGKLTEVFVVRDRKNGKDVDPYLSSKFVKKVTDEHITSPAQAKEVYVSELKAKAAIAGKLTQS